MKHTSKLAYLLWLPVLVWVSILSVINVVNGEVSIRVPAPGDLHRPHLFSLSLWKTETGANVKVNVNNRLLNVSNWIIMWKNNRAGNNARFASIWWWKEKSESIGLWYVSSSIGSVCETNHSNGYIRNKSKKKPCISETLEEWYIKKIAAI